MPLGLAENRPTSTTLIFPSPDSVWDHPFHCGSSSNSGQDFPNCGHQDLVNQQVEGTVMKVNGMTLVFDELSIKGEEFFIQIRLRTSECMFPMGRKAIRSMLSPGR